MTARQDGAPPPRAGCLAFLRRLEEHRATRAAGGPVPEHAAQCRGCARRLALAVEVAAHLRVAPPIPAALRSPAFLEAVYDRSLRDLEPLGEALDLTSAFAAQPPAGLEWPLQRPGRHVADVLRETGRASMAPPWLWRNVREQTVAVRRAHAARQVLLRRVAVAASLAAVALFGWQAARSEGTSVEVPIVTVPVSDSSILFAAAPVSPVGALRLGVR